MGFNVTDLIDALQPLTGLQIAQIYHAVDMRGFTFVHPIAEHPIQQVEWALHVSCTWRLEKGGEIVTGSYDWFEHATRDDILLEEWDPAVGGSLQEKILRSLLLDFPGKDGTIQNNTDLLFVEMVDADEFGGFLIAFRDSYRLRAFPSTTRGELWRVFRSASDAEHFVVGL